MALRASIVGGSGYAGGELLRLLLVHPQVEVAQVTSQRFAGRFVHGVHPNLRGATRLKFNRIDDLLPCDLLFLALPHGRAAQQIVHFDGLSDRLIDLSADFRVRNPTLYETWYGTAHPRTDWLDRFVYGLPEIHREELREAHYVSGVGCNATAVNLALFPFARRGLIDRAVVEVKVGSSEAGNSAGLAGHHPERSGCVRSFAPVGHRHQAEMIQELGDFELFFSATAVEMVRGVLSTAHLFLSEDVSERDVWQIYREAYGQEPFVRLVKDRRGIYRYPEPKILAGTNFCDIGFAKDPGSKRLVVISAIDNLMKGAAGTAVQAMNVMMGWPEKAGLEFVGLHPI
ncbi:MAG: N-acetyl-gamma-glutamyl-phosphate reductase [Anaerolineaceae bacterium]|nr:MAG: N-acetyl-gamma-glutamyl-phosphate reductase [Anaerolineaceae bacterium]